ncbi:S8 family serine peptidase [Nonomuraea sp. CA-143628]|uniref:S8 family serine peptidase n=1 Tax=Nonomuraea sp. CA-143628 TaxID=3239997 RepID=UPI003D8DBA47
MSLGGILASALLASTITVAPPPERPPPAATTGAVTLITGDRVVVTGASLRVEPGPGRRTGFTRQVIEGHLQVIPFDARPLLARGVLDPRLFDVTQLLQWRYGDADRPDIPVITQSVDMAGARRLAGLGMSTLRVSKKNAAQTWKDLTGDGARALAAGKAKLWLDGRRPWTLDKSVKQIGATEAWKQGFTGKGVTVAVLDSGYDPDHPDLKGVVTHERNFSDEPDIRDNLGHGTHVASIVAGAGEKYRGVAPGANLAVGKVGGRSGPSDSAVLAGMEWAATEVKAKVVSMSLGGPDTPEADPVEQAVNTLSERTGTLFVISAGNSGAQAPVSTPGSADAALTVGAVDDHDRVAGFSSRGPREGDHAIKPDITAPGVDIMAAEAGGTYVERSGTSMAAPHVAGAAAIMAQRHPDWTGQQLKAALIGSAAPTPGVTPYETDVRGEAAPAVRGPLRPRRSRLVQPGPSRHGDQAARPGGAQPRRARGQGDLPQHRDVL